MKNIIFSISFALLICFRANADESMRRCMLLPINDSVKGAIAYKVYQKVEEYLIGSSWCYYKTNSEIMNVLGNYKKNLQNHLDNEMVLKVIADRGKAGSLIKVDIKNQLSGVDLMLDVIGPNGKDIYFREKGSLDTDEIVEISRRIIYWLEKYNDKIPYDGKVSGVLGDQLTMDIGKGYGVKVGQQIKILRYIRKRKHPLLKEVVDWDTVEIGKGFVTKVIAGQANAKMTEYYTKRKLKKADWVKLISVKKLDSGKTFTEKVNAAGNKFGKLGKISMFINTGRTSHDIKLLGSRAATGFHYGMLFKGEIWLTRNLILGLDVGKNFASMSGEDGSWALDSYTVDSGEYKFKAGYKYLPLGFFFGPQITMYAGVGRESVGPKSSAADGLAEYSFLGPLFGIKGDVPVKKDLRIYMGLDFMVFSDFSEETLWGKSDSNTNYMLEIGGEYNYMRNMKIDAAFGFKSNKATFASQDHLYFRQNFIKIGASFIY